MPIFSRRRLDCFYCGKKSNQRYEYGLPKWKCEHCLAENYLDANGEITEPPPPTTPIVTKTQRFARLETRSASPKLEQSPFCQTCLNNQLLVTQNLSNYLPETTDPRYHQFEENLPKYKKELEERYPPVCANCEPRVRELMRAAGKLAKADYLGRMMDKTRRTGSGQEIWTPATLLRMFGGFLWFMASVLLIVWNTMGTLAHESQSGDGLAFDPEEINLLQCIGQAFGFGRVESSCPNASLSLAYWGTAASLVSVWWNPIMSRRNIDRTQGLAEYYKLQVILLIARIGVWYTLVYRRDYDLEPSILRLIHATMLSMNIGVSILAYSTARIAKIPRISFQDNYEPIGHTNSGSQQPSGLVLSSNSGPITDVMTTTRSANVSFPFDKVKARRILKPSTPIKPGPEEFLDDSDAMDIDTPVSQHNFRSTANRDLEDATSEPSPFYGKIPPAPFSQERRLRNPPNKPSFQKTSDQRQEKFFQSMTGHSLDVDHHDTSGPIEFRMQPPKMVLKQDHEETGLENWFSSKVFSLGDSTAVVPGPEPPTHSVSRPSNTLHMAVSRIVPLTVIFSAISIWQYAFKSSPHSPILFYAATGLAAIVTNFRLAKVISGPVINGSDVLLCLVELFGAAAIGYQIHQIANLNSNIAESLGSFPLLYFGFMIIQEMIVLYTVYRSSRVANAALPAQVNERSNPGFVPLSQDKKLTSETHETFPFSLNPPALASAKHNNFQTPIARKTPTTSGSQHQGLAGLSLSLDNGSVPPGNTFSPFNPQATRTLRSRTQKPWEVGGI